MSENYADHIVNEILLKFCGLPFMMVGSLTGAFYSLLVDKNEISSLFGFFLLAGFLHTALFAFWGLVYKPMIEKELNQRSFSKTATYIIFVSLYVMGFVLAFLTMR